MNFRSRYCELETRVRGKFADTEHLNKFNEHDRCPSKRMVLLSTISLLRRHVTEPCHHDLSIYTAALSSLCELFMQALHERSPLVFRSSAASKRY